MASVTLNPDVTRRDDGAYWAAAMVLALKADDRNRANEARRQLRRLGYRIELAEPRRGKAAINGR
jgi:hypothetical protein